MLQVLKCRGDIFLFPCIFSSCFLSKETFPRLDAVKMLLLHTRFAEAEIDLIISIVRRNPATQGHRQPCNTVWVCNTSTGKAGCWAWNPLWEETFSKFVLLCGEHEAHKVSSGSPWDICMLSYSNATCKQIIPQAIEADSKMLCFKDALSKNLRKLKISMNKQVSVLEKGKYPPTPPKTLPLSLPHYPKSLLRKQLLVCLSLMKCGCRN